MFYIDDGHRARFEDALRASGALKTDGKISAYYGASLYLLTGLTGAWPRLSQYVELGCIDFPEILDNVVLSSGERLIVQLAGNFYNGGFWEASPLDLVGELDVESFALCLEALRARKTGLVYCSGEVSTA
nr:MAG TPA: Protein of unknown function (DUF2538) [Caudoviricetes sp.]